MGETPMGSTSSNRIRPVAQLASVLLLVVAMTASVQLRNKPQSRPPQLPPASAKADPVPQVVIQTTAHRPPRRGQRSITPNRHHHLRCPSSTVQRWPGRKRQSTRPAAIGPGPRPARRTRPGGSRPRPTRPRSMPPWRGSSRSGFATPQHRSTAWPRGADSCVPMSTS